MRCGSCKGRANRSGKHQNGDGTHTVDYECRDCGHQWASTHDNRITSNELRRKLPLFKNALVRRVLEALANDMDGSGEPGLRDLDN